MATQSPFDSAPKDVIESLAQTSFAVIALLSQLGAENDLSLTQLRVLAILRDREPTISELAAHLGLERSSVSGLVDRSVNRGLVRRDASLADGRAVRVSLSAAGQRLAKRLTGEFGELIAAMTQRLTPAEQNRLKTLLDQVLDQVRPDGGGSS